MQFLGIDTSNYTTSAAILDSDSGKIFQQKMLLPGKDGQQGLRQSDAVFHHTQQLPIVMEKLCADMSVKPQAIGVSAFPRRVQGSYMPCFTVGISAAKILSNILQVPLYTFSHQEGHIAAALYSAGRLDLLNRRFIAFHISGGTTEALIVDGTSGRMDIQIAAKTLDLNAGQAVDRVGIMLNMKFPCGNELETAALQYTGSFKCKPFIRDNNCSLSGVENRCRKMLESGESREKIAAYCLCFIKETIASMCEDLLQKYGELPLVFAGGVMSNSIIRSELQKRFLNSFFAEPIYSADNAAGTAVLTEIFGGIKR